ncbi:MAG: response regulator [Anaerolineae bacterium]|nr:response regulator [Anaerolineae bacterium]
MKRERVETPLDLAWFTRQLRMVLISLYDPSTIRHSPLAELFDVERRHNPMFALQYIILNAIEALKPTESMPASSRNWRVYQILRRRYSEQATQREVALELGLGLRQMQREENLARQTLAEYLWTTYQLESRVKTLSPSLIQTTVPPAVPAMHAPSPTEELEKLRETVPAQMTDLEPVIREALKTLGPSLAALGVSAVYKAEASIPRIWSRGPVLRQALVSLVSLAVRYTPGGQVYIQPQVESQQVCLLIHTTTLLQPPAALPKDPANSLQMVEQLMPLCRGSLEVISWGKEGQPFTAKIILPTLSQATVLVIDDNADTRQLFRRYLSGSHYRFAGAADAEEGLALALELEPQFIVLDVMMPGQDGWAVLGQLREHPQTGHIPIIVSTILPQEELALDLGAADFIRKPVSQTALLSALDRQLARVSPKPY